MPAEPVTVQSITRKRKQGRWGGWVLWSVVLIGLAAGGYAFWQDQSTDNATLRYTTRPAAKGDITVIGRWARSSR